MIWDHGYQKGYVSLWTAGVKITVLRYWLERYDDTMEEVKIRDDYIKLGQALKLAGLVESGIEAKMVIQDGQVKVNGQVETQRGKKLVENDEVSFDGNTFVIKAGTD